MSDPYLPISPIRQRDLLDLIVSWAAFGLLTCSAVAFVWFVPQDRDHITRIFEDFHLKLLAASQCAADVPTAAIIGLGIAAILTGLLAQIFCASKRSASIIHLVLIASICLTFLVYRETLGNPFLSLIQGMTGGRGGR